MQVVMLHYAGPPVIGGVESTIDHHARLLSAAGHSVTVIAGQGESFHPQVDFFRIPEVASRHPEVLNVGQELAQGKVSETFTTLRDSLVSELLPLLEAADACIVHNVMTLHKNLPLTAALHRINEISATRFIAWSHDFAWQDPLYIPSLHSGYPWDLLRTPWPGVRYVVVSAHRQACLAELLDMPQEAIEVATPGVDPFSFLGLGLLARRLVETLDLLNADPLMLLPARITRRKNIEFAIRVTAAIQAGKPNAALLVTGPPGPHNPKNAAYLQSLQQLRTELQVQDHVHFIYALGEGEPLLLPDETVAELYRLADLLIFPSHREGFGIPVLEAGLARLPVFAADIPPVEESGGDIVQRFDPEGDPADAAQAIAAHLEKDPAYALRRRVLNEYTWQAIVEKKIIPLLLEVQYG